MMISMFDHNRSGTIDVNEFGQLFNYVNQWRGLFMNFDRDRLVEMFGSSISIDQSKKCSIITY